MTFKGAKLSEETKKKMGLAKLGEKNHKWKGDQEIHRTTLHDWVRSRMPKPLVCPTCKIKSPYDLANITGIYNRELKNWKYLCRSCHWRLDKKFLNFKQYAGKGHISGRTKRFPSQSRKEYHRLRNLRLKIFNTFLSKQRHTSPKTKP
jgi:hypothetical protein